MNPLFLTILVYVFALDDDFDTEYAWILILMIVFHVMQVIYVTAFIFKYVYFFEKHENIGLWGLCCCICCSPLILLICQITALAMYGEEEESPVIFIWVLADTLISTLSMALMIFRTWENDRYKKGMKSDV